jgi:hypothetical protein
MKKRVIFEVETEEDDDRIKSYLENYLKDNFNNWLKENFAPMKYKVIKIEEIKEETKEDVRNIA